MGKESLLLFSPGHASRVALVALLASVLSAQPFFAQAPAFDSRDLADHGTFEIFSTGKSIGTETFEIRVRNDAVEASGQDHLQVEVNGGKTEVRAASSLMLDSQLHPLSYAWNQKGTHPSELTVNFRTHPVQVHYLMVNGQKDRREFELDRAVLILDDNALYQYQLAVARYDAAKGGTQEFHAFIPQQAVPGAVTLNFTGTDTFPGDARKRPLQHYRLTTELAQIDLWTDARGHLQGISAAAAQYQAVRRK